MSKFKVGDRVVSTSYQVYGGGRVLKSGYEGTVTHVEEGCIAVDNKLGRNNNPVFCENAFKFAKPTFKVGDRVVCITPQTANGTEINPGYVGTVTDISDDGRIAVDGKVGAAGGLVMRQTAFELAKTCSLFVFKKGDRVRLVNARNMAAAEGTLATVEAPPILHEDGNTYLKVVWDAEGRHQQAHGWYYPKYFELVEDAAIGFDEFKQQLHTILDKALKAGIGVRSIYVGSQRYVEGKYVLTSLEIDAEVSGYSGESK